MTHTFSRIIQNGFYPSSYSKIRNNPTLQFYFSGSKCSEGLRSLPKAKKLGIVFSSLALKAKEAPFRRSRSILAPSIYSTRRLFKARKINSTVIKTENISSYETGLQERRLTCSTGGSLGNF